MKIALFGAGQMGHAIAHMIKKLGKHHITTFDIMDQSSSLETDKNPKETIETIKSLISFQDHVTLTCDLHNRPACNLWCFFV